MRHYNQSTIRKENHLAAVVGLHSCGKFVFGILVFHDGCLFVPCCEGFIKHIIIGLGCGSNGALKARFVCGKAGVCGILEMETGHFGILDARKQETLRQLVHGDKAQHVAV